jgi:hypothetical protein
LLLEQPRLEIADFERRSGWHVRPEGLCRDDICLPLPPAALNGAQIDISELPGMPAVHDPEVGLWALGPPASSHVLETAVVPAVVLPDLDGQPFDLATLRGSKVLLLAWASW